MRASLTNKIAHLPRIHGFPKLHKVNVPNRPVVDTTNSPSYFLFKFMNDILKQLIVDDKYDVKNSRQFKEFISTIRIPDGFVLTSYDAISLYTNTDTDEVITILKRRWPEIETLTPIHFDLFFEILEFCLHDSTYFTYNDVIYKQKISLAMGLSLASTLAGILLTELFDECIQKFLRKYIDDIITAIPEDQVDNTRDILNNYNQLLKFISEVEKDRNINFLDLTLIHMINEIIYTNWFSKPTSSNRILNYVSTRPRNMKLNIAISFVDRVLSLIFQSLNQPILSKSRTSS